ncbi:hypothetical protein M3Y96_01028000 [Aphelenchoides besseyi]|nr:hypothetical protein M3Y96_01028000 [Aphelenchoides besseyi]
MVKFLQIIFFFVVLSINMTGVNAEAVNDNSVAGPTIKPWGPIIKPYASLSGADIPYALSSPIFFSNDIGIPAEGFTFLG